MKTKLTAREVYLPSRTEVALELSEAAEKIIIQFELAWGNNDVPEIAAYLPQEDNADCLLLLEELVRVDMEFRARRDLSFSIGEYFQQFPRLIENSATSQRIEAEQTRLQATSRSIQESKFPELATRFLGFELIGRLGRGAFGQVYLARQDDLARRLVALKITRSQSLEAHHLAKLQHTNIVPVFSVHQSAELQAICMPFLGIATLADLVSNSESGNRVEDRSGRELISTVAARKARTMLAGAETIDAAPTDLYNTRYTDPTLNTERFASIGSRRCPETFAWLWHQVTSGLSFAHAHGIVHGDIKPANILISDDGHPLLLDFNLASNRNDVVREIVGGTLPYMSAQQIRAVVNGGDVDEQCDLFSLGVVFFQLLSGRLPFPVISGEFDEVAPRMIEDRQRGATPIRQLVTGINPDLASIVDKCLDPHIERRYDSADALAQDLQRYLEFKPLLHAPNRSWQTRLRNWTRRHPRLTSATSVAGLSAVALLFTSWLLVTNWQRLHRLENWGAAQSWVGELQTARLPLSVVDPPVSALVSQTNRLRSIIEQPPASWIQDTKNNHNSSLTIDQFRQVNDQLIASRLSLAGALLQRAKLESKSKDRPDWLAEVDQQQKLVSEASPARAQTAGYLLQRSRWAQLSADEPTQIRLRSAAAKQSAGDAFDRIRMAYEFLTAGDIAAATPLLEQAVESDGLDFEAWLLLGNARALANRSAEAEACFSICISLNQESETAYYNRARARFELKNFEGANTDYSAAIQLNSSEPAYFANRALISLGKNQWAAAERDLTLAIACPAVETRVYYLRHQSRLAQENKVGAAADLKQFLRLSPLDEESLIMRGVVFYQQGDLERAMEDFEQAIELNPASSSAWINKATILTDAQGGLEQAIAAMTRVVELEPANATQLATRGVLLARAGQRFEAHQDAQRALELDASADTRYRVAGIYSQTSKQIDSDKDRAMELIALAMLDQPRIVLGYIDQDPDLEPLQNDPRLIELKQVLKLVTERASE